MTNGGVRDCHGPLRAEERSHGRMLRAIQATTTGGLEASAVALFGIGAAITLMTGRGVLFSGARQLLFGLAAVALTYGVGRIVGVSLPG